MAATLDAQRALAGEAWPGLPGPLRVRMGLRTGEADLREGDYYGTTVNRAARLMSIAAGGQILLSATTAELAREQLPEGASLRDLGEHRLKDLAQPEQVFQLTGSGLPADFPALKSLDAFPNNLPVQLTSFVGREREVTEVKRFLATTRLLTLTGPGGTGKTRLSLQASAEALESFADGIWLVELAPLADPALVAQAAAVALGVRVGGGRTLLEALIDFLRRKQILLILDNCEHLVEACSRFVETLLRACPKLKVLASSREALGIAGEAAYRVPSLALPEADCATPDALARSESARLFVERAQAHLNGFAVTEANAGAIAQICRRLDGIPLALELAAARVKMFRGFLADALPYLEHAAALFLRVHDKSLHTACRSEMGHLLRRQGRNADAAAVYAGTIRVWLELGQRSGATHELECFAFVAIAQGNCERAARLFGAAEALREAIGTSMTPLERREYDAAVAQLRGQMDEAALMLAWAAGRALDMDQAIDYAAPRQHPPYTPGNVIPANSRRRGDDRGSIRYASAGFDWARMTKASAALNSPPAAWASSSQSNR